MSAAAIVMDRFSKRFGEKIAVEDLSLTVPAGSIFGLAGQNGAGKTTTIRALLNLVRPSSGRLQVLGLDPQASARAIHNRVGYVPEAPDYYGWMTVAEMVGFNAAFYDRWDGDLAARLMKRLELPKKQRLATLSRGMKAKVGLVMALGSRPDLLILDDPTSGLDPIVRREFLEETIANVQAEGGTVFFSSHLLHEMERIADTVAILHQGKLRLSGSLEVLKAGFKKLRAVYPQEVPASFPLQGLVRTQRNGRHAILTVSRFAPAMVEQLRQGGASSVDVLDLPLEEIFVETIKGDVRHA
jgi:ABC-2 type transport system ATP-binding protein